MQQLKIFIGLCICAIGVGLGIMAAGWWMLVPLVGGALWAIAGDKAKAKAKPHPSFVASQPSKPASTATWQETVEAIERARHQHANGTRPSSDPKSQRKP